MNMAFLLKNPRRVAVVCLIALLPVILPGGQFKGMPTSANSPVLLSDAPDVPQETAQAVDPTLRDSWQKQWDALYGLNLNQVQVHAGVLTVHKTEHATDDGTVAFNIVRLNGVEIAKFDTAPRNSQASFYAQPFRMKGGDAVILTQPNYLSWCPSSRVLLWITPDGKPRVFDGIGVCSNDGTFIQDGNQLDLYWFSSDGSGEVATEEWRFERDRLKLIKTSPQKKSRIPECNHERPTAVTGAFASAFKCNKAGIQGNM